MGGSATSAHTNWGLFSIIAIAEEYRANAQRGDDSENLSALQG